MGLTKFVDVGRGMRWEGGEVNAQSSLYEVLLVALGKNGWLGQLFLNMFL